VLLAYFGGPSPAPGSTVAVLMPSAQISKYPTPADIGGATGHEIDFQGNVPFSPADDTDIVSGSNIAPTILNPASPGWIAPAYLAFY
jgi:hypothetical protein